MCICKRHSLISANLLLLFWVTFQLKVSKRDNGVRPKGQQETPGKGLHSNEQFLKRPLKLKIYFRP